MRKIILVLFTSISLQVYSQIDSEGSVSFQTDTTWNHEIEESSLILKLQVNDIKYMTDQGIFSCDVLKVIKGIYKEKKASWIMEMIELSVERWEKRFRAIWPKDLKTPFTVYAGFYTTEYDNFDLEDKSTGKRYNFYMSVTEIKK